MAKLNKMEVNGNSISLLSNLEQDYICITDIARYKDPDHIDDIIKN